MIEQNARQNQLPNEIKPAFKELKVLKHLKTAGFRKNSAFPVVFIPTCLCAFVSSEELVSSAGKRKRRIISWQGCGLPFSESQWLCVAAIFVIAQFVHD